MKKRIALMLAVLLTASILLTPVCAIVEQSESYYVADYANVLSADTEQTIIDANAMLEQNCEGAQIVVVTIDYLPDNYYADEYARQLFNNWHVGSADANNGILLLLVTQEAKGWLVTGDGISGKLTNREVNDLLDNYFWDYVDKGQYEKAVTSIFDRLLNWYEDEYDVTVSLQNGSTHSSANSYGYGFSGLISIIVILCIVGIFLAIMMNSFSRTVARRGGNIPMWMLWMMCNDRGPRGPRGPRRGPPPPPPGGFGGFGGGGGFRGGGSFGGGMGHGGGGFSGGGGGRR